MLDLEFKQFLMSLESVQLFLKFLLILKVIFHYAFKCTVIRFTNVIRSLHQCVLLLLFLYVQIT